MEQFILISTFIKARKSSENGCLRRLDEPKLIGKFSPEILKNVVIEEISDLLRTGQITEHRKPNAPWYYHSSG